MALVRHPNDPQPIIAEGEWHGQVLRAPRGSGGFGYDPLFLDPLLGQTGAELPAEQKNRISHRAKALTILVERLSPPRPDFLVRKGADARRKTDASFARRRNARPTQALWFRACAGESSRCPQISPDRA